MGILDQDSLNRETCCMERDAVQVSDMWCGSDSYPHDGPVFGRLPWHTRPIGRAPSLPSSRTPRLRVALPIAGPDNLGLCVTADPCSPGQPSAPRWPTIAFVFWFNGCVNPILTRRGNTLFPRQPIRRTWGQLGEQLDRVVGAAGFVHRRKSREVTVSE